MERKEKIRVSEVTLKRLEGNVHKDSFEPVVLKSFDEADRMLRQWAETAPDDGCYFEIEYEVRFEDGETLGGTYQLIREDVKVVDLRGHLRDAIRSRAGLDRSWMTEEGYRAYLARREKEGPGFTRKNLDYLEQYDLGEPGEGAS